MKIKLNKSIKFLYYVNRLGNFGDELSKLIVTKLIGSHCEFINLREMRGSRSKENYISALGSIIHMLPRNCNVWCSGIGRVNRRIPTDLKVHGLRGPLTFDLLNKNGYSLNKEKLVFGDPALLLPRLFPVWLENPTYTHETSVLPHYRDAAEVKQKIKGTDINFIDVRSGIKNVVSEVRTSKKIISSALHGIIVSEMLSKETSWLQLRGTRKYEGGFKYQDYFQSTKRYNIKPNTDIKTAMHNYLPPFEYDDSKLYASFATLIKSLV